MWNIFLYICIYPAVFFFLQISEIEELNLSLGRKNTELHHSLDEQATMYKAQVNNQSRATLFLKVQLPAISSNSTEFIETIFNYLDWNLEPLYYYNYIKLVR